MDRAQILEFYRNLAYKEIDSLWTPSGSTTSWTPTASAGSFAESSTMSSWRASYWSERLTTVCQFGVISTLGLAINVLPLILTCFTRLRRHEVNLIIVNLTLAEFLLCCSFVFGQTFYILWHEDLPAAGCHYLAFFHFTMAFASFIFPPILAINRYVSLYHSHLYPVWYTRRNVMRMIGGCWSFCAVVPLMFMIAGKTGYDEDNHHCCMVLHGDVGWTVAYWIVIIAPLVVFCDGATVYCNYRIYKKLMEHACRERSMDRIVKKNKEILYFLIADMLFPVCFHSTYHIFKFALEYRTNEFSKNFFISLYLVNSILRGFVTIVMLRPYREMVKNVLCGKGCTSKGAITSDTKFNSNGNSTISPTKTQLLIKTFRGREKNSRDNITSL